MNANDKYRDLDKAVGKEIMKAYVGKIITHVCPSCAGLGVYLVGRQGKCEECNGSGEIKIQY